MLSISITPEIAGISSAFTLRTRLAEAIAELSIFPINRLVVPEDPTEPFSVLLRALEWLPDEATEASKNSDVLNCRTVEPLGVMKELSVLSLNFTTEPDDDKVENTFLFVDLILLPLNDIAESKSLVVDRLILP